MLTEKSTFIETWQQGSSGQGSFEVGAVERLFQSCVKLSSACIRETKGNPNVSSADMASLQYSSDMLRLWGDGYDVQDGGLDRVLQRSRHLRELTLSLLISIGRGLADGLLKYANVPQRKKGVILGDSNYREAVDVAKYTISSENVDEDTSISDSDTESLWGGVEEVLEDIRAYVDSLTDLDVSIEASIDDTGTFDEAIVPPTERPVFEFYANLVKGRFPTIDVTLANQFGEANWGRYQRLRSQRLNYAETKNPESISGPYPQSTFRDSGLGTTLATQSLTAPTLFSSASTTAGVSHRRLPPLSDEAKQGAPFTCDACGKKVQIQHTFKWKAHIFQDLLPYSCLYVDCTRTTDPFQSREAWINHLGSRHGLAPKWESHGCLLCSESTGNGCSAITRHLARHLEEIALAALPQDPGSDTDSEAGSDISNKKVGRWTKNDGTDDSMNDSAFEPGEIARSHEHSDASERERLTRPLEDNELDIGDKNDIEHSGTESRVDNAQPRRKNRKIRKIQYLNYPSRQPADDETYVMEQFRRHATHCNICSHPYTIFERGEKLCVRGESYANDVSRYIFDPYYRSSNPVHLEFPPGWTTSDKDTMRDLLSTMSERLKLSKDRSIISQQGQDTDHREEEKYQHNAEFYDSIDSRITYPDNDSTISSIGSRYDTYTAKCGSGNSLDASNVLACSVQRCQKLCRSKAELDEHLAHHRRPFRCLVLGCKHVTIGFLTDNDLNRHEVNVHKLQSRKGNLKHFRCRLDPCQSQPAKTWSRSDKFHQHLRETHDLERVELDEYTNGALSPRQSPEVNASQPLDLEPEPVPLIDTKQFSDADGSPQFGTVVGAFQPPGVDPNQEEPSVPARWDVPPIQNQVTRVPLNVRMRVHHRSEESHHSYTPTSKADQA